MTGTTTIMVKIKALKDFIEQITTSALNKNHYFHFQDDDDFDDAEMTLFEKVTIADAGCSIRYSANK